MQAPRRAPVGVVLAVGAALGGAGVWFSMRGTVRSDEPQKPPPEAPAAVSVEPPPKPVPPRHGFVLRCGEQQLDALLLRAPSGRLVGFLSLASLPLRGQLADASGDPWPLSVVALSEAYGFVLLDLPVDAAQLVGLEPLPVRAAPVAPDTELRTAADGEVKVLGYDGHRLTLAIDVDPGAALRDAAGAAAALGLGGRRALPVSPAYAFLTASPAPRSLDDARAELRGRDPVALLEDVAAAINAASSASATRAALERLELNYGLARGPELVAAYERALRDGHRVLAQRLAVDDPAAALAQARSNIARFAGDVDVLADAVILAAGAGDHHTAADLWLELASRDQARARDQADGLVDALTRAANTQAGVQPRQAAELLARAVDLFPDRAALRMNYANSLLLAGDGLNALAQARAAAQLDPTLVERADAIAGRVASGARSVEIPIDAGSHVVRANCSLAGRALEFVVDTGASITIVPTAYLALGSRTGRQMRIQTASGMVDGELLRLSDLKIGGITMHSVQAVAIDLPGTLAGKGLLGMNVLRRLNLELDGQRDMLVLRR